MNHNLIYDALQLVIYSLWPIFAAVLCGAVLAGILRVTTQIDDPVISLLGRIGGVLVFGYFAAVHYVDQIAEFAKQVWGGVQYYF